MNASQPGRIGLAAGLLAVGVLPIALYLAQHGVPAAAGAACPLRHTPVFEQWVVLATAFVVKPAYMVLALALIVVLWRRTAADLAALRWGLGFFLAGELACAFNYVVLGGRSELWEYFHDYGMVAGFGFVIWAVLEAIDRRFVHFSASHERCAALALCRGCVKYDASIPCGLARVFSVGILALLVIGLVPLAATLAPVGYVTHIAGTAVTYESSLSTQWFVMRYCPVAGIGLLIPAWVVLQARCDHDVRWPKLLLAAALGALGFAFMRLFLLAVFHDNLVWYTAWEEITELLFVLGVVYVLFVFRAGLFAPDDHGPGALDGSRRQTAVANQPHSAQAAHGP